MDEPVLEYADLTDSEQTALLRLYQELPVDDADAFLLKHLGLAFAIYDGVQITNPRPRPSTFKLTQPGRELAREVIHDAPA